MNLSDVGQVVTIQEAAKIFGKSPKTIRYHMDRGRIAHRRIGGKKSGVYILSLSDLISLYGDPPKITAYLQAS